MSGVWGLFVNRRTEYKAIAPPKQGTRRLRGDVTDALCHELACFKLP